jgi:Sigma-54 interaction domain
MAVGPPIQASAVGKAPIWVGDRRRVPGPPVWSNGRKIPALMGPLLGDSPAMRALRERAARLLQHASERGRLPPVLIQGETGTGKGLLARVLHDEGPRKGQPFVTENCAAIPETLLEARFFGYERGAFTDAKEAKSGLFQAANRGTLFLDEVALLPEGLQAKLLKAWRIARSGGSAPPAPRASMSGSSPPATRIYRVRCGLDAFARISTTASPS